MGSREELQVIASMGPRLGGRGNRRSQLERVATPARLQWGHVLVDVETTGARARRHGRGPASMGPRLGGRGNAGARALDVRASTGASMGPRLGGRGNASVERRRASSQSRFNGATSWWTWKRSASACSVSSAGHASMGPRLGGRGNGVDAASSADPRSTLQWGHVLVDVETASPDRRERARRRASMGPRLGGRGNRRESRRRSSRAARASMGPRLGGRGNCGAGAGASRLRRASMGPRLGGRGNARWQLGSLHRRSTGFNGATSWWTWKHSAPGGPPGGRFRARLRAVLWFGLANRPPSVLPLSKIPSLRGRAGASAPRRERRHRTSRSGVCAPWSCSS